MPVTELLINLEKLYLSYGLPIVFLTSLIEITPIGWIVPGGSMLTLGGFFAYGRPAYLIATIFLGWIGSWTTFFIAYVLGAGAAKKLDINLKAGKAAKHAEALLKKQGPIIMTSAMVASVTRFWISSYAGSKKFDLRKFTLYSGVASFSWTTLMIVIGYLAGTQKHKLEENTAKLGMFSWVFFAAIVLIIFYKIREETEKTK